LRCSPNRSCPDDRCASRRTLLLRICTAAVVAATSAALLVSVRAARGLPEPHPAGPKVVLVRMARCCPELACHEAEAMLADELDATALEVELVEGEAADAGGGGDRLAVRLEGRRGAALRLFRDPVGGGCAMEIWAQGDGSGERTYRRKPLPEPADPDADLNAAIEAAEAVFAGLLELKLISEEMLHRVPMAMAAPEAESGDGAEADAGAEDAGAAPPATPQPNGGAAPPERDRRLGAGLGAGVIWSPGGVGPRGAVRLAFDARFVPWLTLRADVWVSVLGADVTATDARASFDAAMFRIDALYEFVRKGMLRPALGISGGGVVVWTAGVGAGEYVGSRESATAGYAGGAGRLAIVLSRWFRLEVGASVGAVMPEVRVRFAGEDVARFGRPLVDAFAQVELSFY
jgi:hypothetical protein